MDDYSGKGKCSSRKRLRKSKSLEFVGWGSRNLIDFLASLGRDTTNKISEYDVTDIVRKYINEQNLAANSSKKTKNKTKTKTVACDMRLRLLFDITKINIVKLPDLVAKHYVENQDDDSYYCSSEGDADEQQSFSPSVEMDKQTKQAVRKPKGRIAAIVSDNIKLLYLRKTLVQDLAKTPETFEGKVMGTFVRMKNPCQLVQVTGVKEGNPIDGYILQVTNYCYYLEDVSSAALSDDDFSQEECEELHERIKNGFAKRLTVVEMEEKARSLHEDVTKHWLARELVLLQRQIYQANEKGWRRELSQYLEKRQLLSNPEEQSRLLLEVPEVVAEEIEPECVDDDVNIENDFMEPASSIKAHQSEEQQLNDSPVSSVQKALEISKLRDEEDQPSPTSSAGDEDLHEDVEEQLENGIITQNKDSINDEPQAQLNDEASCAEFFRRLSGLHQLPSADRLEEGEGHKRALGYCAKALSQINSNVRSYDRKLKIEQGVSALLCKELEEERHKVAVMDTKVAGLKKKIAEISGHEGELADLKAKLNEAAERERLLRCQMEQEGERLVSELAKRDQERVDAVVRERERVETGMIERYGSLVGKVRSYLKDQERVQALILMENQIKGALDISNLYKEEGILIPDKFIKMHENALRKAMAEVDSYDMIDLTDADLDLTISPVPHVEPSSFPDDEMMETLPTARTSSLRMHL